MVPQVLYTLPLTLLFLWPADRAAGQLPCHAQHGALSIDTVSGVGASVVGYFPSGARAASRPSAFDVFDSFVLLVPAPGTLAPARRAVVDTAGAFDLGVIAPGRYFVFTSGIGGLPFYGDVTVVSQALSLCLGPPELNLRPGLTFVSNGPDSPVPGFAPSDADAAAIGDAIGRWLAAARSDSRPMWMGGSAGSMLDAARRGFMISAGDSALPPISPPPDRFRSAVSLFAVGLLSADSALVIASTSSCSESATRATGAIGSSTNGAYVVVRSGSRAEWVVRQYVSRLHATLRC